MAFFSLQPAAGVSRSGNRASSSARAWWELTSFWSLVGKLFLNWDRAGVQGNNGRAHGTWDCFSSHFPLKPFPPPLFLPFSPVLSWADLQVWSVLCTVSKHELSSDLLLNVSIPVRCFGAWEPRPHVLCPSILLFTLMFLAHWFLLSLWLVHLCLPCFKQGNKQLIFSL